SLPDPADHVLRRSVRIAIVVGVPLAGRAVAAVSVVVGADRRGTGDLRRRLLPGTADQPGPASQAGQPGSHGDRVRGAAAAAFIAMVTLLPALMYFQFDAERLGTLRDRW